MKSTQWLFTILAFALGAGLVAALKPSGDKDSKELAEKLAASEKRNSDLEAKSLSAVPKAPAAAAEDDSTREPKDLLSAVTKGGEDGGEPEQLSPEEQIAKLFNSPEARNLIKGFAGAMSGRADQWIGGEVDKYKEKLDLTDAQSESITKRMVAMVQENTEKFQAELDDGSRSMQEIMESQGDFWRQNEDNIEVMLKEELNEEQFGQFKTEQLVERTGRVQRSADRELAAIDSKLELDDTQEDQVFDILVRTSPEYDEAMAIEGIEADIPAAALAEDTSKEDAIRAVLDPEQLETYDATLEDGGFNQRRRGPWGAGGFGR